MPSKLLGTEINVQLSPSDIAYGEQLLDRFRQLAAAPAEPGAKYGTTASKKQQFCAQLAMLLKVEWIVFALRARRDGVTIDMADPIAVIMSDQAFATTIGGHRELAQELGGDGLEDTYLAALHCVRLAVNSSSARKDAEVIPPGGDLGIPPLIILGIVGVAAIAGVTWWAVDANEKQVAISNHAAELTGQVNQYSIWLDDQLRRGNPAPPPPPYVTSAAKAEKSYPWWAMGTGLVLGGTLVVAVYLGVTNRERISRAYTVLRENPSVRGYRRKATVAPHTRRSPRRKPRVMVPRKAAAPALPAAPAAKPKRKRKKTAKRKNPISRKRKAARKAAATRTARKRHAKRAPIARGQGARRTRSKKRVTKKTSKRRTKR